MSYKQKLEEQWVPDILSTWTNIGTCPVTSAPVIKINGSLYIFGGLDSSTHAVTTKIYSTSWNNPTGWTDTGSNISGLGTGDALIGLVNNTLYSWGSVSYTTIWSAPMSNPLNWTTTGVTNPSPRDNSGFAITPTHITMCGGYNGSTGNNNILYASISTPTTMSTGGAITGWERSACYLDGEEVFIFGGAFSASYLTEVHARIPGNVLYELTSSRNYSQGSCPAVFHVGNYIHVLGNANQVDTFSNVKTLDTPNWRTSSNILPASVTYVRGCQWIGPDGYAYIVNYSNGSIYKSERRKIYVIDSPNPNGLYTHRRAVYADTGDPTTYTIQCQMGMNPWYTNRRDRF